MSTNITVFRPNAAATVNLAVSGTTGRVQVLTTATDVASEPVIRLYNAGTVVVFVNFGDVTVTATTAAGMPIAPGATEAFGVNRSETYVAAISAGTAATLYATPGYGV